jgi:hypothetical protein
MKNFKTIAALFAATVMLASCGKESVETPAGGDGTTSVKIGISYPEGAETRAVGPALADDYQATFKPGHIFFTNASGVIDTHVTVDAATAISGVTNFTTNELTTGEVVVTGISSTASMCYIISNDVAAKLAGTGITSNQKGNNISTILDDLFSVSNMQDATGNISNVPMYGVGNVQGAPANSATSVNNTSYTALVNVQIQSLASHLQIKQLTAVSVTNPDSKVYAITDYTVDGIYINNVNPTMTVDSTFPANSIVNNGSVVGNYVTTSGSTYFTGTPSTGSLAGLADEGTITTTALVAAPTTGYWAYNVFPQTDVPHIIVKLSGVKYTVDGGAVQTIPGNQWLTIAKYKEGTTPVTAFAADQIYTLNNIQFDYNDLTIVPEASTLDVNVTVTMFKWNNHDLDWDN